jgi:enamine deaminase RidA (YjgF/YER057c/UK114 family)
MSRAIAINPAELGAPSGYNNGLLAPAGARLLFVAGQVAWDDHQRIVGPSFPEQFRRALENMLAVVRAAGGVPTDVLRLTCYATSIAEYLGALPEVGAAWRETMGKHFPAMALVEVARLVDPAAKVEIEATAAIVAEARDGH